MRSLRDQLSEGFDPTPEDVGAIMALAARALRHGHDQGATHGDVTPETLLVGTKDGDWVVELAQPRQTPPPEADAAGDILGLGRVLELLVRGLPASVLPELLPAALASMTDPDPGRRPRATQVEQYFVQDYPDALPTAGPSDPTVLLPVDAAPAPRDATAPRDAPQERRRPGTAVLISVLVLILGLGALGTVLWRTLGTGEDTVAGSGITPTEGADAEADESLPRETTDAGSADDEATDEVREEPTGLEEAGESTAAQPEGSAPASPAAGTASPATAPVTGDDDTDPEWEAFGWDAQALDLAYCRDGSRFVGLADTETYRGVVCSHSSGYSYRGLNKAANATLLSSVEPWGSGWQAAGDGGVVYEFDEDTFTIYDGDGSLLDQEDVTTWLTPQDTPFRPGDLDLSEPITYPACDGSAVVVLGSWTSGGVVDELVQDALDANPGSFYIRTDLACDNFNRPGPDVSDMKYIYSVMRPLGYDHDLACAAIEEEGTFGYWLQEGVDPGIHIDCG